MIQIRNVPPEVHEQLRSRAKASGRTLSDYLLDEIRRIAVLPTLNEWVELVRADEPVRLRTPA